MIRRFEILWLYFLVLSFCYERPLVELSSIDRTNPRLFDLATLGALVLLMVRVREPRPPLPKAIRTWGLLVLIFCMCAGIYAAFFLPFEYGMYSLFFAAKYVQGFIVILAACSIKLTAEQKSIIHKLMIFGGLFVAAYSLTQYGSGISEWHVAGDKVFTSTEGVVFGPLSLGYFHLGQFSTLSFAMALAYAVRFTGLRFWGMTVLAMFVAYPALVCGSRASLLAIPIILVAAAVYNPNLRRNILVAGLMGCLLLVEFSSGFSKTDVASRSVGLERLFDMEGSDANNSDESLEDRILVMVHPSVYLYGIFMPVIGAGFYVAPVGTEPETAYWRPSYGIHNAYLFPFEQAGAFGFALFALFCFKVWSGLRTMRRSTQCEEDEMFSSGLRIFFIALIPIAIVGQVFWYGFETGNMNTYIILTTALALRRSGPYIRGMIPVDRNRLAIQSPLPLRPYVGQR